MGQMLNLCSFDLVYVSYSVWSMVCFLLEFNKPFYK